jgi:hypothetical protein
MACNCVRYHRMRLQLTLASDNSLRFLTWPSGVATLCAKLNCISGWSVRPKLQPVVLRITFLPRSLSPPESPRRCLSFTTAT